VIEIGERMFLEVVAHVYRSPDDRTPTVASAWEPFPGRTPYTRDSEAMNAETSAVGRALGLAGYGSTKSIASREEVQARQPGGLSVPVAKGRVLAAAQGDQNVARDAWRAVFPDNPATIDVDRLEAAENVARQMAGTTEPAEPPADPVAGIAAARKALEEVTAE
jgi:hypothetical protein